ncbi:MAG: phenylalanine--tRNA ligase subunit beta [Bacteroidia bacterium]|nr:phenylalanine--tRNA ligase subunit beta [Bacteroidia bacterium]
MTILYSWLKEFVEFDYTPAELQERLTMLGLEVAGVERIGGAPASLDGVVVGEVLSAEKHPNADRLRICQVDLGQGEPVQIVCGAPNVAAGQKVPVATIGTTLQPWGKGPEAAFEIKEGKIRGERSAGMICAEDELGLGPGHDGILVLDPALVPGTPFASTLDLQEDYVLEVELTPNRVDAASHYGVARDLAALLRKPVRLPDPGIDPASLSRPNPIPVSIQDGSRCKRYSSIHIEGVTVAESPAWLRQRIEAIGLRPINNIVDVTNYVLHELGHPLHAFDAGQLRGGQIVVRTPAGDEPFVTLDQTERTLKAGEDLMICDAERPLCIAGVMGGLNSGVTAETRSIFLESAYFEPGTVRRSARRMGLSTDSSWRFERGADPNMTVTAALRAAGLILQVAGGTASQVSDVRLADFPPKPVALSVSKAHRLIGKAIPREEIIGILRALEIGVEEDAGGDLLHLLVPPYRVDVHRDVDVLEDLLRVYGYNSVEIPALMSQTLVFRQRQDRFRLRELYASQLSAAGFYEILNNSLTRKSLGNESAVHLLNPLSEDLGIMRQSMLHGVLETLRHNQNRQEEDLAVYEFGKTYARTEHGFREHEWMALAVSGLRHPMHWEVKPGASGLGTVAREAERILRWFGLSGELAECEDPEFDYGMQVITGGRQLLRYGKTAGALAKRYDLRQDVYYLLLDWEYLLECYSTADPQYQEIPLYPMVQRDLSLLLDRGVPFAELRRLAQAAAPELIRSARLHDVYQGKNIPEGKKSYLISLELRDSRQTLSDKQVDQAMQQVIAALKRGAGAEIRTS